MCRVGSFPNSLSSKEYTAALRVKTKDENWLAKGGDSCFNGNSGERSPQKNRPQTRQETPNNIAKVTRTFTIKHLYAGFDLLISVKMGPSQTPQNPSTHNEFTNRNESQRLKGRFNPSTNPLQEDDEEELQVATVP